MEATDNPLEHDQCKSAAEFIEDILRQMDDAKITDNERIEVLHQNLDDELGDMGDALFAIRRAR